MSLERLAVHPYAYAAMQQNSSVYGPNAVGNMGGMGTTTGMGLGRFRPTLPATTHSTPTGTPQARTSDLPLPPGSTSTSHLPTIPGGAGSAAATTNDDAIMDDMVAAGEVSQRTDLAPPPPPPQSVQPQSIQSMQDNGAHPQQFDDMGR